MMNAFFEMKNMTAKDMYEPEVMEGYQGSQRTEESATE
jgi:hypothetical protein